MLIHISCALACLCTKLQNTLISVMTNTNFIVLHQWYNESWISVGVFFTSQAQFIISKRSIYIMHVSYSTRSYHVKGNKFIQLTRASFSQNPQSWDTSLKLPSCTVYHCTHSPVSGSVWQPLTHGTHQPAASHRCMSSTMRRRRLPSAFPVLDGTFHPALRHVYEANLRNSLICQQK